MNKKLKIGLLLDSYQVPAWVFEMIHKLINSSFCEIVLVVKNKDCNDPKISLLKKIILKRKTILYSLFTKLENKFVKCKPDAFELKDLRDILNNVETLEVTPIRNKFRDIINDNDIEIIKKNNVDIFIRLGFRILSGEILKVAKYGVWSYHHGDNKVNRGGPPGFWEVYENNYETGVILQILTEDLDDGIVLYKSFSSTRNISPKRNKNNYYWKALSFLPSKIEELYKIGNVEFFNNIKDYNPEINFYCNKLYKTPNNKEMLIFLVKIILRFIKKGILKLFYYKQWIILYNINKNPIISFSLYKYKSIIPPKDRFWADPFCIEKNNKFYIFIEEFLYSTNKGHISVLEIDKHGNYSKPIKVIEKNYHLSYPFLIEYDNNLYMIPESAQNNTIELYKCIKFPYEWELKKIIMNNIKAVDTTVFFKDNKFWLFTNISRNKGASSQDELFLFYADDLLSDNWHPHPLNPIVSDVKKARPAGNIFFYNGNLYRPSQNCSKIYGYGVVINKIIELNEFTYKEIVVDNILPNWSKNLLGVHTFNWSNNLSIIDAFVKRNRFKFK